MAIFTSDGERFDDEWQYAVSSLDDMHMDVYGPAEGLPSTGTAMQDNTNPISMTMPYSQPRDAAVRQRPPFADIAGSVAADWEYPKGDHGNLEDRRNDQRILRQLETYGPDAFMSRNTQVQEADQAEEARASAASRLRGGVVGRNDPDIDPATRLDVLNPPQPDGRRGVWNALTGADGKERYVTWPEKAVRSVIGGLTLPGDVAAGKVDPLSDEAIARTSELAGTMVFGPMPLARKVVDGTLGSIAGVSAKGANKENLALAKEMMGRGMHDDQVWQATGWFKGGDGMWRTEIPMDKAKLRRNPTASNLGEVLSHPELYKAYPELKDIPIVNKEMKNTLGAFDGEKIFVNYKALSKKSDPVQAIFDTIIHEVQHAIQKREGFNYGTTMKDIANTVETATKTFKERGDAKSLQDLLKIAQDYLHPVVGRVDELKKEVYRRSPGEIEARLIEWRSRMNDQTKKDYSPARSEKDMLQREQLDPFYSYIFGSSGISDFVKPQ